ncbi:hypothetical protein [Rufibacter roseus]|uniref:Uncharacterized protein n=1 Tax=Rufibacter roseus TaxID=1567108 RepID=A0ABW2DP05_9BACT|nr:hypothetical protein [Rufibacter roseus]
MGRYIIKAMPSGILIPTRYCLWFDQANDRVDIPFNTRYNVGVGDMALVLHFYKIATDTSTRLLSGKGTSAAGYATRYNFAVQNSQLRFGFVKDNNAYVAVGSFSPLQWTVAIGQRVGGGNEGNLQMSSYEVYSNGARGTVGSGTLPWADANCDNTARFTLGAAENGSNPFGGFLGPSSFFSRKLLPNEIGQISNNRYNPSLNAGLWGFHDNAGLKLTDLGSGQNHGSLINYTATEVDLATNTVWCPYDGVCGFSTSAQTYTFTAPNDLTIYKAIRRVSTVASASWVLKEADGAALNSGTMSFDSAGLASSLAIAMAQGQKLEITYAVTANAVINLFY